MIVDCQTHIWTDVAQLGKDAAAHLRRQSGQEKLAAGPTEHSRAAECVDRALVLGFCSRHLSADVPNELIAEYVSSHPGKMIGIAAVDPTDHSAVENASVVLGREEFRGLTLSPAAQNFHPADSRAMALYELAAESSVPVLLCQGTHFHPQGRMEYARPSLLDEVAGEFPDLKIVISSLGHPWIEEGIALLGKHKNVHGDISGLIRRPWQAYNALVLAHQFNVMDKVMFASDFPFYTAAEAIEAVYRLHEVTQGTNLPAVPREVLRSMIERDSLDDLGIAGRPKARTAPTGGKETHENEA